MAHAKLSPSSAERWMTCPGSVALSEGIEDKGSAYAEEGTAAHEMAEMILTGRMPAPPTPEPEFSVEDLV